jgi:hypothetical protein
VVDSDATLTYRQCGAVTAWRTEIPYTVLAGHPQLCVYSHPFYARFRVQSVPTNGDPVLRFYALVWNDV